MNLQNEYSRRHKINCIIGSYEGLIFVQDAYGHIYAIHTGLSPKIHQRCSKCPKDLVVELISIGTRLNVDAHFHVSPDTNIIPAIRRIIGSDTVPLPMPNQIDMEFLIWRKFRVAYFNKINPAMNDIEQMFHFAIYHSDIYQKFTYQVTYLLGGRKYLLNV